ncbi:MFS transporter [Cryobacterium sp.]|uniref:MFS transporter n=1 Tax=Cryobacterium sp. TaxID=1926290 RepID=UPI00262C0878|nr:MFS transporter [Cryobacterium sp.]MCU1446987.1 transporter [Cryobacterium sp.]
MNRNFRSPSAFTLLRGPNGEQILAITCLIAATQMVWGILVPILPAFASEMGISADLIGMLVAGFGIGRVLANIPAGLLGRRVNRASLLVIGALGVVVFSALSGLVGSFELLLALRVLTGVAGGIAITSGQTLLADSVERTSLARAMALLQGLQLAGGAVGPALGGLVATTFGMRAPFFVSGAVCFAFLCWIVLRRRLWRSLSEVIAVAEPAAPVGGPRRSTSFVAVCAVGFSVFFSRFGVQQTLLPLIAYQALGFSVGTLGVLFSGMAVLNIVCAIFLGGLSDRVGRKRVIVGTLVAAGAATVAFALPMQPVLFIGLMLAFGLATSIGGPVPAAYVAEIAAGSRRGPAIGIYRTFGDLAGIVGPIVIGLVIHLFGFTVAIVVSSVVAFIAALVFALLARETVTLSQRQKGGVGWRAKRSSRKRATNEGRT